MGCVNCFRQQRATQPACNPGKIPPRSCSIQLFFANSLRPLFNFTYPAPEPFLSQFSRDGVPEAGFGDAVTNSFYCDVADAFCLGDLISFFFYHICVPLCCFAAQFTCLQLFCLVNSFSADSGMWIISQADIDSWGKSSDGELSAHRPLVPSNGLYIQPYCSSLPMPPTVLSR